MGAPAGGATRHEGNAYVENVVTGWFCADVDVASALRPLQNVSTLFEVTDKLMNCGGPNPQIFSGAKI